MRLQYNLISEINPAYSPLEQVLCNRGIKIEDIPHYLSVSEADNLSFTLLNNIQKAVQLLVKHLYNPDGKIFVIVDSDYDGMCSAACLLNYIYATFPSAIGKFSYDFHSGKQHGIEMHMIPTGTTLVVAPDGASSDYEQHKTLKNQGIDVLVLDHHLAPYESQDACIVNNQLCDYPNKALCGTGIVYKFCQCMDSFLQEKHADDFIDLVGTAIIGDMMDLRTMESHYLSQQSLKHFRNPFLKGMKEKNSYSLGDELTPIGVAFYIVPLVNAITRVGTQEEKRLIFESMLDWKAYENISSTKRGCKGQEETRVEQAVRTCTNVKNRQTKAQDASVETIEKIIEEQHLLDHKLLIIRLRPGQVTAEVRGLIANKLMAKYQRPVAILTETMNEGKKAWMGSGRGYDKSELKDFRGFCENSGLVFLAQGHSNACGIGIYDEDFEKFIEYSDNALKDVTFSPSYKVDFIFNSQNFNAQTILDLGEHKELWGQEIGEPLIALEHIAVTKDMVTLMSRDKNPTLKIQLSNGVACIKFKSSEEEYEQLLTEQGCVTLNIVGKPEINKYFDRITPQLIVTDYEITNKQDYYF